MSTLAYDLDRFGVFSNGSYADIDQATDTDSTFNRLPACSLVRSFQRWSCWR